MYLPFKELADPLKVGAFVVYENNGVAILGSVISLGAKKHRILNQQGSELELQPERLVWIPGSLPTSSNSPKDKAAHLRELVARARETSLKINLEHLWSRVVEKNGKSSLSELSELQFGSKETEQTLAMLLSLYADKKFFKRLRQDFEARDRKTIEELRAAESAEKARKDALEHSIAYINNRLNGSSEPFPSSVLEHLQLLEDLALDPPHTGDRKIAKEFLDSICAKLSLKLEGHPEAQSYELLCKIGHITPKTDLVILKYRPRQRWNEAVRAEVEKLKEIKAASTTKTEATLISTNLTELKCFTIDDLATNDMDDALSVERTESGFRIGIHISNVSDFIPIDGPIDREAKKRATSIYCPNQRINMLPEILAEDLCSLRAKSPRLALSIMLNLDSNFRIISHALQPSVIEVKQRFTYEQVDALLLHEKSELANDPQNWEDALNAVYQFAGAFEQQRMGAGGLKVARRDVEVSVSPDGTVLMKEFDEDSPARSMVGEMMILANKLCAEFGVKNRIPLIYRSQADPDEDPYVVASDVPLGPAHDYALRSTLKPSLTSLQPGHHSTLGLRSYVQVTSPIRRFADLCNQRQLLSYIRGMPLPYRPDDLGEVIDQTEEMLGLARSISRESKRYWILRDLETKREAELSGTVIRTDLKNPLVEIERLYITLMAHLNRKPKLGEKIRLRIAKIDSKRDLIRLEEV